MSLQKYRLQKGWSQEELASIAGVSTRTVQRIEKGEKASPDSLKALAAVFNLDFNDLKEHEMQPTSPLSPLALSPEEHMAFRQVKRLRGFYTHAITYAVVITGLIAINLITKPQKIWFIYPLLGWGIGLAVHGFSTFGHYKLFGADWEKREVEKILGRKL
jgi:transcriptional regulator with XRE-family HTH domain